jgi:N4-gp56 family major capsid protein
MAQYLDVQARDTLSAATSASFGYNRSGITGGAFTNYDEGVVGTSIADLDGNHKLTTGAIKDSALVLAGKNIPRIGETYVQFIHPKQSRDLRSNPEFIEVTKYAAPGNFMLGEIGRLYDVVFIETTQVKSGLGEVDSNPATGLQDAVLANSYTAMMIGDNAFGQAIALPVELRDGGVIDFGREHGLSWYAIWGFNVITHESRVLINTLGGSIS